MGPTSEVNPTLLPIAKRALRYTINLDGRIKRDRPSNRGGQALISRGILKPADGSAVIVAVKTAIGVPNEETAKRMFQEAHTWSKLKHPNVLSILGITLDFGFTVSLVTQWIDGGSAFHYVQKPDKDPRPLIKDIALGLRYLHNHPGGPIVHGDLKGDNVLITFDGRALLTDFGLSVLENSSFSMTVSRQAGGSLRWMAPELVNSLASKDPSFNLEGDIWAFGMTTLELFTRKHPHCNLTNRDSIQARILKGLPEQPSIEDTCSRMTGEWWNLCLRCWKKPPSSRITAEDVVRETRELPPRNDIVIVVMGPAGSGKSNFVSKLAGCEEEAGKPISPTQGIREFVMDISRDKRYVFVDTPELDNASESDQDILRRVAEWLRNRYLQHVKITGVIYTHRTTDNSMPTLVRENLTKFCELCGENAAQRVRLVTARWDEESDAGKVLSWVSLLKGGLWKPPTAADARHEQFVNTQNSALNIVNGLVGQDAQLTSEEVKGAEMQLNEISVTGTRISSIPQWFGSWFSTRSPV